MKLLVALMAVSIAAQPLRTRGHALIKGTQEFFWLADTAWEIFHWLDREKAGHYVDVRARQGYNVVLASAFSEFSGRNEPNAYGVRPFVKEGDPTQPNDAYFRHVDDVIKMAEARGMYVGLLPAWGDKVFERPNNPNVVFNPANAFAYGRWLGRRYRTQQNIVWVLGGDRNAAGYESVWRAMARGLREGDGGAHLITFHPNGRHTSSIWFHSDPWLAFNAVQSGHNLRDNPVHEMIRGDYTRTPVKPVIDLEPAYENHPVDWKPEAKGWFEAFDVRKHAHWAVFAGAAGHTYGCHDIWQFIEPGKAAIGFARGTDWRQSLLLDGAVQLGHLRRLVEPLQGRVPDQGLLASRQGFGDDYIAITRAGSKVLVYTANGEPFTIRLERLAAKPTSAEWFDPRTGAAQPARLTATFQPPSKADWVLVIK